MRIPAEPPTVARQLLDEVARHGASTVFGLPGVHNLAFWRSPDRAPVVVRHEQSAVYAADGWARATGALGAAVVTTGPGAANAVAAFGEAAAAGSPVLLVASEIPQAQRRPGRLRGVLHESRDQAALFAPLARATFTPRTPAEVAGVLDEAIAAALRHPRGPVYLDVPADVLGLPAAPKPPEHGWHEPDPGPDQLDAAAALLRQRVVIWAGGGAVDATASLAALAEHLGAPVVSTYQARGCPPTDHPAAIGLPPHEPEVAELIGSADVLLAVGGDLDGMNTRNWSMPRPPVLVTVDPAPVPDPEWTPDAAVTGRVGEALRGLLERVPKRLPWAGADLRGPVLARLAADPSTADAVALVEAVQAARGPDTVLVCDMAVAGYWVGGYAAAPGPRRLAYPVGWGTLGFGLPAAIGPAAAGHPTVVVCGDGGLMMALGELATLVQQRLPVVVLVVDDGGYGMLRYDQEVAGHPRVGVDLVTPDFPALAAAFGLPAVSVDRIADLPGALARAVGPCLVHVTARLKPPRTTSPRWHEDYASDCERHHIARRRIAIYRDGTRADPELSEHRSSLPQENDMTTHNIPGGGPQRFRGRRFSRPPFGGPTEGPPMPPPPPFDGPVDEGEFGPGMRHGPGRRGRRMGPPPFGPGFGPGPRGFGPFPGPRGRRGGRRTSRGDIRLAVLALVAEQPRHGYEIIQEIAERSGGAWRPSPGSVYPTLSQLEDEGLVLVEQSDGRKVVRLTEAGTTYVEEHRDEVDAVWAAVGQDADDDATAVWEQLGQLHAATHQVLSAGTPEQITAAGTALAEARKTIYRLLAE